MVRSMAEKGVVRNPSKTQFATALPSHTTEMRKDTNTLRLKSSATERVIIMISTL